MASKVFTTDLKVGMFIADLDRPWEDTPFLLQGFLIEDDEQIATLRAHCEFVIVDRARSVGDEFEAPAAAEVAAARSAKPSPAAPPPPQAATRTPGQRESEAPSPPPAARKPREGEERIVRLEDVARRSRGGRGPGGARGGAPGARGVGHGGDGGAGDQRNLLSPVRDREAWAGRSTVTDARGAL